MIQGVKFVISEHSSNLKKIHKLAVNEIRVQAKGTTLGYFWTLYKDLLYFIAYGFFITAVFGANDLDGMPKLVFLVSSLFPWYFISDSLMGGGASIRKKGGILTKIKFPITIIPTIEILSIFYKRLASWIIIFIVLAMYGMFFNVNYLMVMYYMIAMFLMMLGFSFCFSGFIAISKDFLELYSSIVRILFFFVPIMWSRSMFLESESTLRQIVGQLLALNPMVYVVEGFRNAFVTSELPSLTYTIYFWIVVLLLFVAGATIQFKLRKIYADYL